MAKTHMRSTGDGSISLLVAAQPKRSFRRLIRIAHLWTGLILGLWLVMLGLTGSALVYQHSLRQLFEQGRRIKPELPILTIDDLLIRVHQQRPDLTVLSISGMEYRDSAWELLVRPMNPTKRETHSRWLLVDPGTGEIRGMQTSNGTFMGFLAQLHYNLLIGETGLALNAFAGVVAIFFAITGLILWWRGSTKWKNGLRFRYRGASNRARNYSIHSAIGFYSALFIAMTGLSGIYFAFPRPFLSTAAWFHGSSLSVMKDFLDPPSSITDPEAPDAPASQVLRAALQQFPDSTPSEIELPLQPNDAWQFHFFSHGILDVGNAELAVIDRRSAKVLAARRTADLPIAVRAVILLRPLHAGTVGGNFTRILWVLFGLTPGILFVTGFLLWRMRLKAVAQSPAG
jgi:uncharacterized iron-regulated membrane protein